MALRSRAARPWAGARRRRRLAEPADRCAGESERPGGPDRPEVVVGVDTRGPSPEVVEFAFREAARRGAVLRTVHGWEPPAAPAPRRPAARPGRARRTAPRAGTGRGRAARLTGYPPRRRGPHEGVGPPPFLLSPYGPAGCRRWWMCLVRARQPTAAPPRGERSVRPAPGPCSGFRHGASRGRHHRPRLHVLGAVPPAATARV
ncbi:universal stress protein [Kitasatospora sp. NPDC058190]|uniref:universal stress protein n=1 Tax=Kitasatospora sp. NPDC058190 TaxID=3346371 RepID=UPI0036D81A91